MRHRVRHAESFVRWPLVVGLQAFMGMLCWSLSAFSGVLPLVVVDAGGERGWWVEPALSAEDVWQSRTWSAEELGACAPARARSQAAVSRVLRRLHLSRSQALSLAGLYGCSSAATGSLRVAAPARVPGLDAWMATWTLEVQKLHVQRALTVSSLHEVGAGVGPDPETALQEAQRAAAARFLFWLRLETRGGETLALPREEPALVVRSPDGSGPYVAFRQALQRLYPSLREPMESWATEGAVALRFGFDEGGSWEGLFRVLEARTGSTVEGVTLLDVEREGSMLRVLVRLPAEEGQL